jgi:hypothetical protein
MSGLRFHRHWTACALLVPITAGAVSAVTLALIEARSAWRSDPERGLRAAP